MSHFSLSTCGSGWYKLCLRTALCLRNVGNCALTSNERKSSQRFMGGCSQVITLSLNRIRFSVSFLNQLVSFLSPFFTFIFFFFNLEIIIYFFSSPNYEKFFKKSKFTRCSVQAESTKGGSLDLSGPWVHLQVNI